MSPSDGNPVPEPGVPGLVKARFAYVGSVGPPPSTCPRRPWKCITLSVICFLALVIQRALRHRLRTSALDLSPEEMLYRLRTVQRHSVRLASGKELEGMSTITPEQREMFDAVGVPLPTVKRLDAAM